MAVEAGNAGNAINRNIQTFTNAVPAANKLNQSLGGVNGAIKDVTTNSGKLYDHNERLIKSIPQVTQAASNLTASGTGLSKVIAGTSHHTGIGTDKFANFTTAMQGSHPAIKNSVTGLVALSGGMLTMAEMGFSAQVRFLELQNVLAKFALATGLVTAALAGLAVKSVVEFAKFETNIQNIAAISENARGNIKMLGDSVLKMSTQFPKKPEDIGIGLYDIFSSITGITVPHALGVLETSLRAATAGLSTTAQAANAIITVLNAYNLSTEESARISDILFETVNIGRVTFSELSSTIGDVVTIASKAGVPIEQVAAGMATLTKAGLTSAHAATLLKNTIIALVEPGTAAGKALSNLGLSQKQLSLSSNGLIGVLLNIVKAMEAQGLSGDALIAEMAKIFPNIRSFTGALALTSKNLEKYGADLTIISRASEGMGATQRALN